MSGRTFGVQASWDEVFRLIQLDIPQSELNKAIGVADSMNQQYEEFLNRFVVTAVNDAGDLVFDAAGSYTFEGAVVVNGTTDLNGAVTIDGDADITGTVTLETGGAYRTADSGQRAEMVSGVFEPPGYPSQQAGVKLYSGDAAEETDGFGYLGVYNGSSGIVEVALIANDLGNNYAAGLRFTTTSSDAQASLFGEYAEVVAEEIATLGSSIDFVNYVTINTGTDITLVGAGNRIEFEVAGAEVARVGSSGDIYGDAIQAINGIFYGGGSLGSHPNDYFQLSEGSNWGRCVVDGSEAVRFGPGIGGSFGNIQTGSASKGGWEGYNINGHWVFMSNSANQVGIYDDAQNRWFLYHDTTGLEVYTHDGERSMTLVDGNTTSGSGGTGYVGFNNAMGGFTGTDAQISTSTLLGQSQKRLGFLSSKAEGKQSMSDWEMSDEAFMKLRPTSFIVNDMYVDDEGGHHHWDPRVALEGPQLDPVPDGWLPLRRFGLMWDDLIADEDLWPIATEFSWDPRALAAGTAGVVQRLMRRMDVVEDQLSGIMGS